MGTLYILRIDLASMFYISDKSLWLAILKRIITVLYLHARIPPQRPKWGILGLFVSANIATVWTY